MASARSAPRRWLKVVAFILAGLLGLILLAGVALWTWKPWVPPLILTEPKPGGVRISEDGLFGNFYASSERAPAILVIGGSEGGLIDGPNIDSLRAEGWNVLALAYHRAPGTPDSLEQVPLEIFDRALDWLARQPSVDPSRVAMLGASKGAEAALLVATRRPDLRAVVLGTPTHVVWQGMNWETFGAGKGSSWSAGGKPLAYLPYGPFDNKRGVFGLYEEGLRQLGAHPDAVIPVEQSRASILLICGGQDSLWPACPMAEAIVARVKAQGGPSVRLLTFPDAGHFVWGGPPLPASDARIAQLAQWGGTGEANNRARAESWPETIAFLHAQFE